LVLSGVFAVTVTTFVVLAGGLFWDGVSSGDLAELANPIGWALILLFSTLFGLPAALTFLGVAFSALGKRTSFAMAGAMAGALHASFGLALRFSLGTDYQPNEILNWALVIGGFVLAMLPPDQTAYLLLPAATFAGGLSGAFFGRRTRTQ
jgi:hypothetical protein